MQKKLFDWELFYSRCKACMEKYRKMLFLPLFTSHGIALDCRVWVPRKFYFYSLDNVHEIETEVFQLHDTFMLSAAWWTQFISSAIKISRDDFTINDSPSLFFYSLCVKDGVRGRIVLLRELFCVFMFPKRKQEGSKWLSKMRNELSSAFNTKDKKVRKGMIAVPFCCWWCVYGK